MENNKKEKSDDLNKSNPESPADRSELDKEEEKSSFWVNKSKWEVTWIAFQMLALVVAAVWTFTRWGIKDASELLPQYNASINSIESEWFGDKKEGCSFTTAWFLNNKGKTPLEVSSITLKVYKFPEIKEKPKDSNYINLSAGTRLNEENILISEALSPSKDDISANGTVSRSISFAYFPKSEDNWFDNNQIGLFVSAKVKQKGSWSEPVDSEVLAGPIYICKPKKEAK